MPDVCDFQSSIHKSEMQSTMDSGISWRDYPGDTLIETFEEKASALDVEACASHADDVLGQAVHQDDDEDGDNADSFDFVQAEDLDGYNDYEKLMIASGTYVDGEQLNAQGARMKTDPEATEGESLAEGSSGEKVQIALTERSIDDQELWENDRANILKEHSSEVAETWESNSKGEFTSERDGAFVDAEIKSSGQETEAIDTITNLNTNEKEGDVNQGTAGDGSESEEPEARPESAEPDDLSESAKPDVRSELAEPDARSESVEPEEKPESAQPENEPESAEPEIELKSAEPEEEPESAEPEEEPESAEPEEEPESAEPENEPGSAEPEDEPETAEPEEEPDSAEPEDEPESAEPEEEPESAEPEDEPESVEPEDEHESAEPEDEPESAEPEDEPESAEPEVKPESVEPDVIHEPAEVEENLESGQSHKVLTPDEGSYELISSIDSDEATRITDSPSNLPPTSATQATGISSRFSHLL